MLVRKFSLILAIFAVAAFACADRLQAASITWGAATTVAGDTDVSTSGTLVYAVRLYSAASSDPTINGVTFTAPGTNATITGAINQDGIGAPSGFSAVYQQLLGSDSWGSPTTVTLNNLTVGTTYQLQVWANDSRSGAAGQQETFTAGNSVVLNKNVGGTGYGQYAVGTFTASSTTQQFTAHGRRGGRRDDRGHYQDWERLSTDCADRLDVHKPGHSEFRHDNCLWCGYV